MSVSLEICSLITSQMDQAEEQSLLSEVAGLEHHHVSGFPPHPMSLSTFFFFKLLIAFILIFQLKLTYNIILVSGVQPSD